MSKLTLEEALDNFKQAAVELHVAWPDSEGDIFGDTYPKYMPDFAQYVLDVDAMEFQRPSAQDRPVLPPVGTIPATNEETSSMKHTLPSSYRPDNMIGNVVGVIGDRTGLEEHEIIQAIAREFGDGDFDAAEGRLWDSYFGPACDEIMDGAGIEWPS